MKAVTAKIAAEKHIAGRPTLYNAEKHIELLFEVFLAGGTVSMFCKRANIGRETFYRWLKEHRVFRVAYEDAKTYAEAFYDEMGLNPPSNFNYSVWLHTMKVRFKHSAERTLALKYPKNKRNEKDFESQLCVDLLKKCYKGEITTKEFSEMVGALMKKVELVDVPKIKEQISELEQIAKQHSKTGR
jgi:hypothetical protein